jgi:hypothetical protein
MGDRWELALGGFAALAAGLLGLAHLRGGHDHSV